MTPQQKADLEVWQALDPELRVCFQASFRLTAAKKWIVLNQQGGVDLIKHLAEFGFEIRKIDRLANVRSDS